MFAHLLDRAKRTAESEAAQLDFLDFTNAVWPDFIGGMHHTKMAAAFKKIATGESKRLIVNMPPRHTKSEFSSYLLPAWLIGRRPSLKIIQTTHTAELAVRFGRKVRNLMDTEEYKAIFPKVELRADSKAAGRWETGNGGEYFAAGVGGAITGRGADLLIIDDPHSEQDALSPSALENAYEWYTSGPRQRLQPGGAIVIVMTRWAENDLTGKLVRHQGRDIMADQWEVIEFPAILPNDEPVWPQYWNKKDLLSVKGSLSVGKWEAQWQQNPTSETAAILKRDWWQKWEEDELPKLSYENGPFNVILLDARRGRWDFPDLRRVAYEEYKYWEPESVLIEAKASGMPLTHELRNMGIPVMNYSPSKGHDKISRVNSVSPMFESGMVWAPDTTFAEEVIEECAAFPGGEHDDYVDTVTQALRRFREGGFIAHPEDYQDDNDNYRPQVAYY